MSPRHPPTTFFDNPPPIGEPLAEPEMIPVNEPEPQRNKGGGNVPTRVTATPPRHRRRGLLDRLEDWLGHREPTRFVTPDGRRFVFDWYGLYYGSRNFYTWNN